MQRGGRGRREGFFDLDDPFGGLGRIGGFGGPPSLMSSFFGGRDPFDDPFFTRPFGSMFGPSMFGPSMFGPSMFGPSMFGPRPGFFEESPASGFLDNRPSQATNSRGPVIEEINSDEEGEGEAKEGGQKQENPKKHRRSDKEPFVEDPDDEVEVRRTRHMQNRNDYRQSERSQPQNRSFSFQSSTVTYGGGNGAYYTSSRTRRTGSDGVCKI